MDAAADPRRQAGSAGIWLNQSATPLERPKELAGRQFLTDEEVAEFKRRAARLFDTKTDSDFPGADNFFHALLANPERFENPNATGNATVMIERTIDNRTSLIVDPPDGKIPPMTAEGQERLARTPPPNAAGRNACCRSRRAQQRDALHHLRHAEAWRAEHQCGGADGLLPDSADARLCDADPRGDSRNPHHSAGRTTASACGSAAVERRLAGPLGGEYAGRRYDEFLATKQLHGGCRKPPRDRAVYARRR